MRTLFDPPAQQHSPTSVAAAERIEPVAATQRNLVLSLIRLAGEAGLTDDRIADLSGLAGNAARPRRIELVRAGLVIDSGRTRATKAGRQATVWVAV